MLFFDNKIKVDFDPTNSYNEISNNNLYIALKNPFRYRGYYYDTETKLYYLNSRYYDAELGRFINIDDVSIINESKDLLNGLNLFIYCNNNPVMLTDENGEAWWHWLIGALLVVVAAVAVVATAGGVLAGVAAVTSVLAGGSAATLGATIAAGAFIGAVTTFAAMGLIGGIGGAIAWNNTGSFAAGFNEFESYGETAMWSTLGSAIVGGVLGGFAYAEQHPKIKHSWATEARNYWKSRGTDGHAMIGVDGYPKQLHHPYGRKGAGFYSYIEMTRTEHIAFHKQFGYHGFEKLYPYTNYFELILRILGIR